MVGVSEVSDLCLQCRFEPTLQKMERRSGFEKGLSGKGYRVLTKHKGRSELPIYNQNVQKTCLVKLWIKLNNRNNHPYHEPETNSQQLSTPLIFELTLISLPKLVVSVTAEKSLLIIPSNHTQNVLRISSREYSPPRILSPELIFCGNIKIDEVVCVGSHAVFVYASITVVLTCDLLQFIS